MGQSGIAKLTSLRVMSCVGKVAVTNGSINGGVNTWLTTGMVVVQLAPQAAQENFHEIMRSTLEWGAARRQLVPTG